MISASVRENPSAVARALRLAVIPPSQIEAYSRRGFLKLAGGGAGLVLAFHFGGRPAKAANLEAVAAPSSAGFSPSAFLRIAPTGIVTIIINHSEMGQGIITALPMLIAEELDADWSKLQTEFAPVEGVFNHTLFGIQMTGGSTSTWTEYERLRLVGATARALLLKAAAEEWNVPIGECSTRPGEVVHRSGKKLAYGDLVNRAAKFTPPDSVGLKDPKDFRLIGKPTLRIDSRAKVTGAAQFGIDVIRKGALVGVVARAPLFGAKLVSFDAKAAKAIPGVTAALEIPSGVVVLGTDFWTAKQGRDAVAKTAQWTSPSGSEIDTQAQAQSFATLAKTPGAPAVNSGDVESALNLAKHQIEADYAVPYLAHAPMEPLNATVELRADSAEIWTGTQFPTVDRIAAAAVLGLKPEQISVHTTFLGGGFGRRATPASDWIVEAAHVANAARAQGISSPVKVVWTREDDLAGGFYRPMFHHRLVGGIDANGKITAWKQTIVGQSFMAGTPFESAMVKNGVDETSVEGASDSPYRIAARRVDLHSPRLPVPTLWWRSVGHTHTALAVECFLDELAHAAGRSPLDVRRELLPPESRERRALELAVEKSGYGKTSLPKGHAHGLAVHQSFGTFVAQVAEVSVVDGAVRVHRITAVVDCGTAVNPLTIEAQVQGSVVYALSALLYGEITLEKGRVQQQNFHQYQVMRIHETPVVDVHVIATGDKMGGIGEPGVPPTFPAVLNAIFAATGKRVRSLPLSQVSLS